MGCYKTVTNVPNKNNKETTTTIITTTCKENSIEWLHSTPALAGCENAPKCRHGHHYTPLNECWVCVQRVYFNAATSIIIIFLTTRQPRKTRRNKIAQQRKKHTKQSMHTCVCVRQQGKHHTRYSCCRRQTCNKYPCKRTNSKRATKKDRNESVTTLTTYMYVSRHMCL